MITANIQVRTDGIIRILPGGGIVSPYTPIRYAAWTLSQCTCTTY